MNGHNIVADTSLLVNFFNGYKIARDVLEEKQIWVSCLTEIELLSFPQLSTDEDGIIRSFLKQCVRMELSEPIRELSIAIRRNYKLKVPDSIIAGTAVHLDFPVVTMDTDFKKVNELEAVILE